MARKLSSTRRESPLSRRRKPIIIPYLTIIDSAARRRYTRVCTAISVIPLSRDADVADARTTRHRISIDSPGLENVRENKGDPMIRVWGVRGGGRGKGGGGSGNRGLSFSGHRDEAILSPRRPRRGSPGSCFLVDRPRPASATLSRPFPSLHRPRSLTRERKRLGVAGSSATTPETSRTIRSLAARPL
jgi:hypothetical protein